MNLGTLFSGPDMASTLMPEWILVTGIIAMILIPNLGDATFRLPIPGKSIRIPYLIGGKRFALTGDPRLPQAIAAFTLFASFITALLSQMVDSGVGVAEAAGAAGADVPVGVAGARGVVGSETGMGGMAGIGTDCIPPGESIPVSGP